MLVEDSLTKTCLEIISCPICDKIFLAQRSNKRIYCSKKCSGAAAKGSKKPEHWFRLSSIWRGMKARCYNNTFSMYEYYGGRGISICEEWLNNFETFFKWALSSGYDSSLEIDRINTNGNYSPENCRWVTHKQQMRNTNVRKTPKTSCYKGVSWCANVNKWRAQICGTSKKTPHIGLYNTEEEAALAYDKVAIIEFGEHACLNFPRKEG